MIAQSQHELLSRSAIRKSEWKDSKNDALAFLNSANDQCKKPLELIRPDDLYTAKRGSKLG